jgi:mono/diheme cytochrome c family protein
MLALSISWMAWGWGGSGLAQSPRPQPVKKATIQNSQAGDGAKKFEENCSRCHNAPEGFSPRISGTIVRHMRVRASLSKKDSEAILKFLNP